MRRLSFALFLCALSLPGVWHLCTPDDASDVYKENRRPTELPALPTDLAGWSAWPQRFETYYSDFVRGRTMFWRTNHRLRWQILGMTPPGSSTIVGRNGWVFFTGNEALDQHRGRGTWTSDMLTRACEILRERRDELRARGIPYLFVIGPDKMSIYPEELPEWALPFSASTPADQFFAAVEAEGLSDCVLDLRPTLLAAKSDQLLYFPLGTHWNALGAHYAYRAIADKLGPSGCPPLANGHTVFELEDLAISHGLSDSDSWGVQWHIADLMQNPTPWIPMPENLRTVLTRSWWPQHSQSQTQPNHAYANRHPSATDLLIVHDSFWEGLIPYITPHFGRTAAVSSYLFDSRLVAAVTPTTVMQICVERNLWTCFRYEVLGRWKNGNATASDHSVYLAAAELDGSYRSPIWDEVRVILSPEGEVRIEGPRVGNATATVVERGIYTLSSPLLGRLRLVFFREGGARHLAVSSERGPEMLSFVAEPKQGSLRSTLAAYAGTYAHENAVLLVQATGSALWVFDELGLLRSVLERTASSTAVFFDRQDLDTEWIFGSGELGVDRVRLRRKQTHVAPVEFRRR